MKEKQISAPEVVEEEVEVNKKRHLNVVFIGHVGRFFSFVFIMIVDFMLLRVTLNFIFGFAIGFVVSDLDIYIILKCPKFCCNIRPLSQNNLPILTIFGQLH